MTGIERLRELANGVNCSVWACTDTHYCTGHDLSKDNKGGRMRDVLNDIADQIEREHAEDCFRMGERAADVSMSAYDLLPQEERDAIAWVREHGGLDAVKRRWKGYVPAAWLEEAKSRHEQRCDRLKAHAWELERKCAERRETIEELGKTIDDMRPRLMPEGMEWPRFEDGEPVRVGDEFMGKDGKTYTVKQIRFMGCYFSLYDFCDEKPQFKADYGERVKRPAPKVLDADGVAIRVGDTVYEVDGCGTPLSVASVSDGFVTVGGGAVCDYRPDQITHRAPVLAADGLPLREGETVWKRTNGKRLTVMHLVTSVVGLVGCSDGTEAFGTPVIFNYCPSDLTHERPDSLDRLAEDISAMVVAWRSNQDLFDAQEAAAGCVGENTLGAALDSLVRRARALAERDR